MVNGLRVTYGIGFFLIVALLGTATYLQFYEGIMPCPLCVLQRIMLLMLGIVFFFGMLLHLKKFGNAVISLLALFTCIGGILFSARQVWLQHVPPVGLGDCGISLQYMFKIFSFTDALKQVWQGGTECSQQGWQFLNLSLAEWSLIWFSLFLLLIILQVKRGLKP